MLQHPITTLLTHLRETCFTRLPAPQRKSHRGYFAGNWLRGHSPAPETGHARSGSANGSNAGVCNLAAVQLQRLQHHEACVCTWAKGMSARACYLCACALGAGRFQAYKNFPMHIPPRPIAISCMPLSPIGL